MKLNNHGWGYKDMIIYGCIILLVLLVAAYNINYLYSGLNVNNGNTTNNTTTDGNNAESDRPLVNTDTPDSKPQVDVVDYNYYKNVEDMIESATLKYLSDYSYDLSNQILKTSLDTLVNFGYIAKVYDQNKVNVCSGYSNTYYDESTNQYVIKPYINCGNYVTEGY